MPEGWEKRNSAIIISEKYDRFEKDKPGCGT
jgi:hypothetical protein